MNNWNGWRVFFTLFLLAATAVASAAQAPLRFGDELNGMVRVGTTTRVSVASDGSERDGRSHQPSISADGRYVAFTARVDDVAPGDPALDDVLVHNRGTGQTTCVSVGSGGTPAHDSSRWASISADGQVVAFESDAEDLVLDDTNVKTDIFIHNMLTGQTTRVSMASDGTEGDQDSRRPSISAEGQVVAFESDAENLVPHDTNGKTDIFVHDVLTGQTTRVSVTQYGAEGNGNSFAPSISADGRYVAYASESGNLVPDDSNSCREWTDPGQCPDVFVYDRVTGWTTRVSVAYGDIQADDVSGEPSISADGHLVAFGSKASNLVPGDSNGVEDVYVHDRLTGQTTRISVASDGTQGTGDSDAPSISADGRFVAFVSAASDLVSDDTNTCGAWTEPGECPDIFVHDRLTGRTIRASVATDGTQGDSWSQSASVSSDGLHVAFESFASNLISDDTNGVADVFVLDRSEWGRYTVALPFFLRSREGPPSEATCADSDGGLVYGTAGYVEGIGSRGYPYTRYDTCETEDLEGYLREFYCTGTEPSSEKYSCADGCVDGACVTPAFECTDADDDGYAVEGGVCGPVDCDDTDSDVNPAATEVCDNGIDDDCDGDVDGDDADCVTCTDADEDGYAVEGGVCGPIDCDDGSPDVNPGATEICDNGIDDDCNGLVDGADPICSAPPNIIVIGWDGLQRDHFWQCYNQELPECSDWEPNIETLSGGEIWNNTITDGGTSTKPGWAQIFTGYSADVTGIYTLSDYQPIPEGYTVFEKIENHFGPDNVVTMFISAKDVHTGGACIGDPTTKNGEPVIEDLGQPYCLTKDHLDYFELDKLQDDQIGNRALELLEAHQNDLFFAFFLFRTPDVIGHLSGEDSVEYSESFMYDDYWLGQIVAKLHELGIYEKTLIYVATDHGFDEGEDRHMNAPYGIFATNDPLVARSGDRKDIAPTFLERYGIDFERIGDADGHFAGYSLYSIPPLVCIPEGHGYLDYPGAPTCCSGLTLINLDIKVGSCRVATGGTGDNSGYCTACGNGACDAPENLCNCPEDCTH